MSNFREKLDELNDIVADFDSLQEKAASLESELVDTKLERDNALDAVHDVIRELNDLLPARPEEVPVTPQSDSAPPPASAFQRNW